VAHLTGRGFRPRVGLWRVRTAVRVAGVGICHSLIALFVKVLLLLLFVMLLLLLLVVMLMLRLDMMGLMMELLALCLGLSVVPLVRGRVLAVLRVFLLLLCVHLLLLLLLLMIMVVVVVLRLVVLVGMMVSSVIGLFTRDRGGHEVGVALSRVRLVVGLMMGLVTLRLPMRVRSQVVGLLKAVRCVGLVEAALCVASVMLLLLLLLLLLLPHGVLLRMMLRHAHRLVLWLVVRLHVLRVARVLGVGELVMLLLLLLLLLMLLMHEV